MSKNNIEYKILYECFKEYIVYLMVSVSVYEREKERERGSCSAKDGITINKKNIQENEKKLYIKWKQKAKLERENTEKIFITKSTLNRVFSGHFDVM